MKPLVPKELKIVVNYPLGCVTVKANMERARGQLQGSSTSISAHESQLDAHL